MNQPPSSELPCVVPNARHAFGGICRLTLRRFLLPGHWLALAGVLAVLTLLSFGSAHGWSDPRRYFTWASSFYVTSLVPIVAFISAGGALRDDLKSGTADYVFTRPVRRPAYIVFRYLSHVACSQLDYLLALAVVVAVGMYRHVPGILTMVPALLLGQVLMIVVFSAFGFLCGLLTSRYVVVGLLYAAIIEGGVGQIPSQLSRLSMTHHVQLMLSALVEGRTGAAGTEWGVPATLGLVLLFTVVTLAATAGLFSRRELAGGSEA